jgi:nitroreductase
MAHRSAAEDALVKSFLGLEADQHRVGFVYIGYPEAVFPPKERPGFEDCTIWLV